MRKQQPPGSLGVAAGGCPGGIKRLSGRVAGLQPGKNSRRRDFNLERVGFLGRTRPRSRPRTHDHPPAQPLPRRGSPPPVRHAAETNFQDEADTWWVRNADPMGGGFGGQTRLITAEPAWLRWCSSTLKPTLVDPTLRPVSGPTTPSLWFLRGYVCTGRCDQVSRPSLFQLEGTLIAKNIREKLEG